MEEVLSPSDHHGHYDCGPTAQYFAWAISVRPSMALWVMITSLRAWVQVHGVRHSTLPEFCLSYCPILLFPPVHILLSSFTSLLPSPFLFSIHRLPCMYPFTPSFPFPSCCISQELNWWRGASFL